MTERMMKWFVYESPPLGLEEISKVYFESADTLLQVLKDGPERTVALRKLLESKDAAIRAATHPGC